MLVGHGSVRGNEEYNRAEGSSQGESGGVEYTCGVSGEGKGY